MAKKHRALPPRRKRLKRPARLHAAQQWYATFTGKHVVKAYARWFGVDLGCALKELQLLGVQLDSAYVTALQKTLEQQRRVRRPKAQPPLMDAGDSDEHFAYIAGYTAGGAPYGVSWDDFPEQPEWHDGQNLRILEDG
jgi:hypothetical protein